MRRKCKHSSSSFPSQAMRLASEGFGPLQKAALFAALAKERKMRVYSSTELFCMTRNELFALHAETVAKLGDHADASPEAFAARDLLRRIRRILAQIKPGP
jgi:hypothetical protein